MYSNLRALAYSVFRKFRPELDRLFFLHIPKCGGTSLNTALLKAYNRSRHRVTRLDAHASKEASDIIRENLLDYRVRLLLYHLANGQSRYISGHYAFDERVWDKFSSEWNFMTILREPVARWYSNYFYNRYKKEGHFRIHVPLEAFVESEMALKFGTTYSRLLTAERGADDAVYRSIANLQRFQLVGVLEEMDVLVHDIEHLLNINVDVEKKNKSPRTKEEQTAEITPKIDKRVRALCAPDIRIYDSIRERIASNGSWLV